MDGVLITAINCSHIPRKTKNFSRFSSWNAGRVILVLYPTNMKKGIRIIEMDLDVDFAAPLEYFEPARVPKKMTGSDNNLGGTTDSLHA
jgi:hypothetical protein